MSDDACPALFSPPVLYRPMIHTVVPTDDRIIAATLLSMRSGRTLVHKTNLRALTHRLLIAAAKSTFKRLTGLVQRIFKCVDM